MFTRDKQRIQKHPSDPLGTIGPQFFRLSATMVELSIRHTQLDSPSEIPTSFPTKPQYHSPEAKVPLIGASTGTTGQLENRAAQAQHSRLETSREHLRICISRISDYGVKTYSWLKTRVDFLAACCAAAILLTLLAFSVIYAVRAVRNHHPAPVKSQSRPPATVQQPDRTLPSNSASEQTHNDAHTLAPNKTKFRRRQNDYVAKDTYVYYGKDGKPSR